MKEIEAVTYSKHTITSVSSYCEAVFKDWELMQGDQNKEDSAVYPWFRGLDNINYGLTPSLYYNSYKNDKYTPSKIDEFWMFQHFQNKSIYLQETPDNKGELDKWLFLMRHYGAPTRLMDWSEGALVGLYFAVESEDKCNDACVWMLHPFRWNDCLGLQYSVPNSDSPRIIESYYKLLHDQFECDIKCKALKCETFGKYALAIRPTLIHPRMINQRSVFTIHGTELTHRNEEADKHLAVDMRDQAEIIFPNIRDIVRGTLLHRFLIPKDSKPKIKRELAILGITKSTLFPDIDGITKDLTWQYTRL